MAEMILETKHGNKVYNISTDGCGCILVGVAAIIIAFAIANTLSKYGWPF